MSTRAKTAGAGTPENRISKADPQWGGKTDREDMEYGIDMLKIKLQSAPSILEKVRLYNQIKTLKDIISRIESEDECSRNRPFKR